MGVASLSDRRIGRRGRLGERPDCRPLWDWYAVPLSPDIETDINKRLGTDYDLAYIIVMVAGLLNILALYDAFDGPAIGRRPVDSAQTSHERSTAKGAES